MCGRSCLAESGIRRVWVEVTREERSDRGSTRDWQCQRELKANRCEVNHSEQNYTTTGCMLGKHAHASPNSYSLNA